MKLFEYEYNGENYVFETTNKARAELKDLQIVSDISDEAIYGVSKAALKMAAGKDLIICLDVQGAQTLKASYKASELVRRLVTIFVSPVTINELKDRLIMRGTDDEQTIQRRLQMAETELRTLSQFDYHLCSQDKAHDWLCLQSIYFAEKMRI